MSLRNLQKLLLVTATLAMTAFVPGIVTPARADMKIAVVDFQRILTESKAGQGLQKQLDTRQHALQDEVNKDQTQLQSMQDTLAKQQQAGKTSDDFAQKKTEFEKKVIDTKQDIQRKHDALEKTAQAGIDNLRQQAAQIVGDIAQRDKIDIVLGRQAVLMAQKNLDITDAVLKQMDAKGGTVDLKTPATSAAPAASAKP